MRQLALIGLAMLAAAGCAASTMPSGASSAIQFENAWARRAPAMAHGSAAGQGHGGGHGSMSAAGAGNGAVYVTIVNRGASPDALVGATTDAAATVELHETVQEGGVMKMQPRPRFEVPAGGRIEMKPGGHHIMLLGLKHDLKPGDTVRVRLTFDRAGPMSVEAPVR